MNERNTHSIGKAGRAELGRALARDTSGLQLKLRRRLSAGLEPGKVTKKGKKGFQLHARGATSSISVRDSPRKEGWRDIHRVRAQQAGLDKLKL